MPKKKNKGTLQQKIFLLLLLIITSGVVFAVVFYIQPATISVTDLEAGDVSGQDILAPYAITYNSEILTEQMREAAVSEVPAKYTTADTNIARKQLERLRLALAYISSVREDNYTSVEEKLVDLAALQDIQLSQDTALGILALSDPRWQTIQQEAIIVLEQVMRNTIRDSQLDLYRRSASNYVSLSIPEDQAAIVAELAAAFVEPNSFYSESLTKATEEQAYQSVTPVSVSYAAGETVIRPGEVVSPVDIEALQQFGLAEKETRWQDYASSGILVVLFTFLVIIFFRRNNELLGSIRSLFIMVVLFVVYLVAARLVLPIYPLTPYVYPMAAYALIVAGLFGVEPALITVLPLIILATYGHGNAYELVLYYGIGSIFGVLVPRQAQRITGYIWVGLSVAASGAVVVTTYRLLEAETTGTSLSILLALAILNGMIAAGFTVLLQYVLAPILGQTTPLQLLELSRPDHPLLEYLLRNSPGTYQHSLQVANLAEQAAERIDANSLLTRVGALYHDIGKTRNPQYFIENQVTGQIDTHEDITPEKSAGIIKHHVIEGIDLANEYKLPRRLQDFITEHHGTFRTQYQWTQAINAVGGDKSLLDEKNFSYPGPRPQSRETALVMLADGAEARVRAKHPANESELRAIMKETVDNCLKSGQLDDTPLTLKDLNTIVDSFTATLKGIYHPRVEYPSLDVPTRPVSEPLEIPDPGEEPDTPIENAAPEAKPIP